MKNRNRQNDFRQQLEKKLEREYLDDSTAIEAYRDIKKKCLANLPSSLYRYRSCSNYSFDGVNRNTVFCALATSLNDIYDSRAYYTVENIIGALKLFIQEKGGAFQDRLQDPFIRELASQEYLGNCIHSKINKLRESCGIASLTESSLSHLMWAHYAANHNGFVLEYDKSEIIEALKKDEDMKIYPVIYKNMQYDIEQHILWDLKMEMCTKIGVIPDQNTLPDKFVLEKLFLLKHTEWSYENEWRILRIARPDSVNEVKLKPKAIYYGIRIDDASKNILSHFAKKNGLVEYQMRMVGNTSDFGLSAEPIER